MLPWIVGAAFVDVEDAELSAGPGDPDLAEGEEDDDTVLEESGVVDLAEAEDVLKNRGWAVPLVQAVPVTTA
jgi:hypothetical protein